MDRGVWWSTVPRITKTRAQLGTHTHEFKELLNSWRTHAQKSILLCINCKRHREQTYGHRERGEDGKMYEESNMETYIIICKIVSQWRTNKRKTVLKKKKRK